jgi:predicted permease
VLADLRFALRTLARSPGFALAAVLSLALGIGANSAIFSVASALLLRPLPYANAERLVILWNTSPGLGIAEDWFSTAQYFDIRQAESGFAQLAIAIGGNENLTGQGDPARVGAIRVSSNLLPMLGATAIHGRLFLPEDDVPGREPTAVLGHGTWTRRFGADPSIVGRSITLNGQPYTVVGVLAPSFSLPREVLPTLGGAEDAEILLPLPLGPEAATVRRGEAYNLLATLAPGVSVAQAQSRMDALTARLRDAHPEFYPPNGGLTFAVIPLQEYVVGDVRRALVVLVAAVGVVLLVACVNVANLLLARAIGRQRELAVRAAIGASRGRLARQMLTESLLLAAMGGALGLLMARWSLDGIRVLGAGSVPRLQEIAIDGPVLAFTALAALGSGLLFGLAPVWRLNHVAVHDALKDAARGSGASGGWGRGQGLRRALVAGELALSVMLVVGAGLLVRSFLHLQRVPPGFNPAGVLTLELTLTGQKYGDATAVLETYRQLWERLAALPGVSAAGGVSSLPLSQMMAWGPITVEGRVPQPGEAFINVDQRSVGGDYFRTMQIPLVRGRLFGEQDLRTAPRVVVIDTRMADTLWPGEEAIGKRVRRGGFDASSAAPWMTVVGIVGHVKQDALDAESRMAMYLPHLQAPTRAMNVVVRAASAPPESLAAGVRREIEEIDADLPMFRVKSMDARVSESLAERRFSMLLLVLFAALALGLAAIGIYGVMAYFVSQGTRELGIRMALGASPREILRLVVGQGAVVAAAGIAIGLAGAFALARFMESLLFEVEAADPLTFAAVPVALGLVALLASYIPARRAARIDPTVSLRSE